MGRAWSASTAFVGVGGAGEGAAALGVISVGRVRRRRIGGWERDGGCTSGPKAVHIRRTSRGVVHRSRDPLAHRARIVHSPGMHSIRSRSAARLAALPFDDDSGVVSVSAAARAGVDSGALQRLVTAGALVPVAKGMYVDRARYEDSPPWTRFRWRSSAFTLRCGPGAVAAEWSAAALLQLPTVGPPPDLPVVLRPREPGRGSDRTPNGRVRRLLPRLARHIDRSRRVPVTSLALTAVDLARTLEITDAIVLLDAAARVSGGLADVHAAVTALSGHRGLTRVRAAMDLVDPRSESVLESRGRMAMILGGLPTPLSNVWIDDGPMPRRVDHLFVDGALVVEADGATKYDNGRASAIIRAEKDREWRLRSMGFEVVRYDDRLARGQPAELVRRIRLLLERRRGLVAPPVWSVDVPRRSA